MFEHALVLAERRASQCIVGRGRRKRDLQRRERGEIQRSIAPLQHLHAVEGVVLQRVDEFGLERSAAPRGAERAVAGGAPGAARDLGEFGGRQAAELIAVIFAVGCEGDVINIEIEAHSHRVSGDQIIDIAGLEHLHLRVAGAWA
ncbi:hypothetical protein AFEL58S_03965 [Afipia felis]